MTVTNNLDVSRLTLEYWTGTAWASLAGSPVSGNTVPSVCPRYVYDIRHADFSTRLTVS